MTFDSFVEVSYLIVVALGGRVVAEKRHVHLWWTHDHLREKKSRTELNREGKYRRDTKS